MANPNPGDPQDRANYPDSTSNDPLNPPSYNRNDLSRQTVERQRYETAQQVRDENNTANGFLIGILLTGLVLGGAALAYFVTQRDRTPVPQRTIIVPSASPSPSPEVRERVIERDRIVPVPQPQQSAPVVVPAPEVRIESPSANPQASPSTPSSQQQEPARQEQPRSTSESTTTPSPEATASPTPSNSGQ